MPCVSYCLLGSALVGSSILTMITCKTSGVFKHFTNMLDDNQKQIYKSVINERLSIYIQTLVLGIIVATIVVFNIVELNQTPRICIFVLIALGINYLGYSLYPKSTFILEHLTSPEQNKAWLGIYKEMKLRCIMGLVLGALGYIVLAKGVCSK